MAGGTAAAAFDPITGIGWSRLWYAGGTEFQAIGYADGQVVDTWPDEIGSGDMTQAGSLRPLYRSAHAPMNNKPCVDFDGSDDNMNTGGLTSIAVPFTTITIAQSDAVGDGKYIHDGPNQGNSGNRWILAVSLFGQTGYGIYSGPGGTTRNAGTAATGLHAYRALNASGNDTLTVDGSTVISVVNSGDNSWQGVTFSPVNSWFNGQIALHGVYSGDITADGNWAAFQSWVSTTYGKSIS